MNDGRDDPVVEIYLGESQSEMRAALRAALRELRLDVYEDHEECASLRRALRDGNPDLIIVDADLSGGDACDLILDLRHNRLEVNPFVPVIVTTWKSDPARVRRLIDSGADGLLAKPASISAIQSHVEFVVNNRKPFVVTSSYIGPDRRKDPTHASTAPLIEVPNTLLAKVNGMHIESGDLERLIARTLDDVNSERLRRNAFEISVLVELLLDGSPVAESGSGVTGAFPPAERLRRLHTVAEDTVARLPGSPFEHSIDLCNTLLRAASAVVKAGEGVEAGAGLRDLRLLKPLSDAILIGFNPNRDASEMAKEITSAIAQFEARRKTPPRS